MYNPMKHSAYTYTGSLWLYIHEILWFATCLLVSKQTMFSCCVLLDVSLKLLPISTRLVVHPIQHLVYPTYLETVYIPYFLGIYIYYVYLFQGYFFWLLYYPHTMPWCFGNFWSAMDWDGSWSLGPCPPRGCCYSALPSQCSVAMKTSLGWSLKIGMVGW